MITLGILIALLLAAAVVGAFFVHSATQGAPWALELARAQTMLPSPTSF